MGGLHIKEIEELIQRLCATKEIYCRREDHFGAMKLPDFKLSFVGSDIVLTIRTFSSCNVEILVSSRQRFDGYISVYGGYWCAFAEAFIVKFFTPYRVIDVINLSLSLGNYYEKESVLYVLQLMFPGYHIAPTMMYKDKFKEIGLDLKNNLEILVTGFSQFIEYDWIIHYGKN